MTGFQCNQLGVKGGSQTLILNSERKKQKQLILWTIRRNCKSAVLLLSLMLQSKMSSERLNDNKKQLDIVSLQK